MNIKKKGLMGKHPNSFLRVYNINKIKDCAKIQQLKLEGLN